VRLYHFAGTRHSAGTLPLTDTNPVDGARGQQALRLRGVQVKNRVFA
jgi:hypothetical protein